MTCRHRLEGTRLIPEPDTDAWIEYMIFGGRHNLKTWFSSTYETALAVHKFAHLTAEV